MSSPSTTAILRQAYAMYLLRLVDVSDVRALVLPLVGASGGLSTLVAVVDASSDARREEMLGLLEAALVEAGVPVPDSIEARRVVARYYAKQIVDGELCPYDGARKIWWDLWTDCRELVELAAFAGLASEYEDDQLEAHRAEYEREILEEAIALLVNEKGSGGSKAN